MDEETDVLQLVKDVEPDDNVSLVLLENVLKKRTNISSISEVLQELLNKNMLSLALLAAIRLLFETNSGRIQLN